MVFQATVVQRKLEDAGFEPKLAFELASVLETDVVADLDERLVTREHFDAKMAEMNANLARVEAKVETRLAGFDSRLAGFEVKQAGFDTKLAELETRMIKWMVGIAASSTLTIILALVRFGK